MKILDKHDRYRKLTEWEYFRLMGFDDSDYQVLAANGVSKTQIYKMAGNSIAVPVLEHLFKQLFQKDGDYGAAIVSKNGMASVGAYGVAVANGAGAMAKGDIGAILVLVERGDAGDIIHARTLAVDGDKIKANTYYTLKNGKRVEVK